MLNANKQKDPKHSDSRSANQYRTVFISDVHLGTKDSKAQYLLEFMKHTSFDQLYLVGDIFDGWKMKNGIYWHKSFNKLIRRALKLTKNGTSIYYITGNHDEFLRKYANTQFDNIHLLNRANHTSAKGENILVIHGDQFESVTHCSSILKYIGDKGYDFLMKLNRMFNFIRAKSGYGYWSFSAYLKTHIKTAQHYVLRYEEAVARGAKKQGYDGVICGHIHQAAQKTVDGVKYMNTGDWVESCSAIVETHEGEFELLHWLDIRETVVKPKNQKKKRVTTPPSTPLELAETSDA